MIIMIIIIIIIIISPGFPHRHTLRGSIFSAQTAHSWPLTRPVEDPSAASSERAASHKWGCTVLSH